MTVYLLNICYVIFWWSLDLTKSKHKSYVLLRSGLNSTTAELHGDIIGKCKVLSCNDVAMT